MLRTGQASIAESYADETGGELFLVNANIPEYGSSTHFNHEPRRNAKAAAAPQGDGQAAGRDQARGRHDRAPLDLFQRPRPRQGRTRPRPRQTQGRQAPGRESPRLAAQPRPHPCARATPERAADCHGTDLDGLVRWASAASFGLGPLGFPDMDAGSSSGKACFKLHSRAREQPMAAKTCSPASAISGR